MCVCTYVYWFVGSSKKNQCLNTALWLVKGKESWTTSAALQTHQQREKEVPEDFRRQSTYAQQGGVGAGLSGESAGRAHRHTNLPFLFLSHLFLQPPPMFHSFHFCVVFYPFIPLPPFFNLIIYLSCLCIFLSSTSISLSLSPSIVPICRCSSARQLMESPRAHQILDWPTP